MNSLGDKPVIRLKYLPKKLWLGKLNSLLMALILCSLRYNTCLMACVTYWSITTEAEKPVTVCEMVDRYLGVMLRAFA